MLMTRNMVRFTGARVPVAGPATQGQALHPDPKQLPRGERFCLFRTLIGIAVLLVTVSICDNWFEPGTVALVPVLMVVVLVLVADGVARHDALPGRRAAKQDVGVAARRLQDARGGCSLLLVVIPLLLLLPLVQCCCWLLQQHLMRPYAGWISGLFFSALGACVGPDRV